MIVEYKFSVKPFKKAQFKVRIYSAVCIFLSSGAIYGLLCAGDPEDPGRIYVAVLIAFVIYGYLFPCCAWFAGKYAFSEDGIHHKMFPLPETVIPWDSVYHVQRENMIFSRSETIDVICFELAPDLVRKKKEYSYEFYLYHQKRYFVIMYSEERMLQVQAFLKEAECLHLQQSEQ